MVVGVRTIRVELDRLLKLSQRHRELTQFDEGTTLMVVVARVARLELDCLIVLRQFSVVHL